MLRTFIELIVALVAVLIITAYGGLAGMTYIKPSPGGFLAGATVALVASGALAVLYIRQSIVIRRCERE